MKVKSKLGSINLQDLSKGLFMTVVGGFLSGVEQMVSTGGQVNKMSVMPILVTSLISGGSYIIKQVFTNSQGDLMAKEKELKIN
jgi:hypothetical protein